jgi:hypothetical protein
MEPLRFEVYRLFRYYKNKGLTNTIHRMGQKLKQKIFQNAEIIFYSDLQKLDPEEVKLPEDFLVEAIESEKEIIDKDKKQLVDYVGREEIEYNIREGFSKSAILWLMKQNGNVIGFIWSIKDSSIKPYFFPLGENDVMLSDGAVLPEYRGRNIFPRFLTKVFYELKKRNAVRVIFDANISNKSVLRSFEKIHGKKLCVVKRNLFLGRNIRPLPIVKTK